MQKRNGAPSLQDEKKWYTGSTACKNLQRAAADVCRDTIRQRLSESPFVGIMIDESIDIATQKKLVIIFKILVDGQPQVVFGTNCEVTDGKSDTIVNALRKYLTSVGLNLEKVIGIGTDGANVMVGCKNGVTTVLQRLQTSMVSVWCCAHRLALVAHWAAKEIESLKKIQEVLVGIFNFFKYSPVRSNKLKELKKIMDEKVKRFKKPTAVRWLSLHEAVEAAEVSWGTLVLTLEHAATEKDATATGLLKEVKTYKFIATLCLLRDVLDAVTITSKVFQRDQIDIEDASRSLKALLDHIASLQEADGQHLERLHRSLEAETPEYQGISFTCTNAQKETTKATCKKFVDKIKAETARRFPEEDMKKLKALDRVLNPKHLPRSVKGITDYGADDLKALIQAFPQLDGTRATKNYRQFKFLLNNNRDLNLKGMTMKVLELHKDDFPDFAILSSISLVIPLTSVPCERAFSVQNSVKNNKRNRIGLENLDNKMLIISERKLLEKNAGFKDKSSNYPMPQSFVSQAVAKFNE